MKKASFHDFEGRIREVLNDPNNDFIPRVQDAGKIIGEYLILHNGLKTVLGIYGDLFRVLIENKGVHEPQEERVFQQTLPHIQNGGTMIELGSYWAFYSMWFMKEVKNAKCFMIEPDSVNFQVGKQNFAINHMEGSFFLAKVGHDGISIDNFIKENNIDSVDILHSDIQGAEYEMLQGARQSILEKKIKYVFISTHSQQLHYECLRFLKKHGFKIIASADMAQTYCHDGVLVARLYCENYVNLIRIAVANLSTGNIFRDIAYRLLRYFYPYFLPLLYIQKKITQRKRSLEG